MQIVPIASGKGGVGKSFLAANLAAACAQAGRRVVLADLDLGAADLHLAIGCPAPKAGIGGFLSKPGADLADLILDTDIPNLRFIPGDGEIPGSAGLRAARRRSLVRALRSLDCDMLILDLGAGSHQTVIDFFLLSNRGILVSAPSVPAILNGYIFLKNAVYRLLFTSFPRASQPFIDGLRERPETLRKMTIASIMDELKKTSPQACEKFAAKLQAFRPRLVMNLLENPVDAEMAGKLLRSCESCLCVSLEHSGVMYRDSLQEAALASHLPLLVYKPGSVLSKELYRIAGRILAGGEGQSLLPEAAAELSALDFSEKMEYVEDLLHAGILSLGDLAETVKTQYFEISKLKRENTFLKNKIREALSLGYKI
jgi:flagellar biosynthesis protein FlhG